MGERLVMNLLLCTKTVYMGVIISIIYRCTTRVDCSEMLHDSLFSFY